MSALDLAALAILGYNTLRGLASGLVRTSLGLGAIILASVLSWQHSDWAIPFVGLFTAPGSLARGVLPVVITWMGIFLLLNGLGLLLRSILHKTPLVALDRVGGALIGLVAGTLMLAMPLLVIRKLPLLQEIRPLQEILQHSLVASLLDPLLGFFP
ncbi:MAG: CvpA family protein [Cyanobacteria bacterium NC_groundwater_1444_Ag_S-0.65um_54_12]|nr:CvpA family protein [Cyanobacteria bacterium NC_groundwater_1444_Ag_S-0.65um_54_12]